MKRLLAVLVLAGGSVNASTLEIGLLARYVFENNTDDQSGNNVVTSSQNIIYVQDRFTGSTTKAAQFNGNSFVYLPNALVGKNINQKFTFSLWAKPTVPAELIGDRWRALAESTSGDNRASPYFVFHADERVRYSAFVDRSEGLDLNTLSGRLPLNQWSQIIFRGDEAARTVSIDIFNTNGHYSVSNYFDTSSDPIWGVANLDGFIFGADRSILIEENQHNAFHNYIGEMDDIRIYNRILSNTEVSSLNALESVPEPSSLSLILAGGALLMVGRRRW